MGVKFEELPAGVQADLRQRFRRGIQRQNARAAGGRRARAAGDSLEAAIARAATDPGCSVVLEGLPKCGAVFHGKGRAHVLPIPCDFAGAVKGSGRGVYFDAKACGEKIAALRIGDPKIVKPHQATFLERMARAGAIAGLLVKCERVGDFRWLPGWTLIETRPVRWDDGRWLVLGEKIDFAKLLKAYGI